MNFGQYGARSSFRHYENKNRAEGNEESSRRVLLKGDYNLNNWPSARMVETFPANHGIVQTIKLRLGDAVGAEQRELVRRFPDGE